MRRALRELDDAMQHMRDVEIPRERSQAEVILERAQDLQGSLESKRKRLDAREQRAEQAEAPGGQGDPGAVLRDPSVPRSEKIRVMKDLRRR